jgi:hypothetical protein
MAKATVKPPVKRVLTTQPPGGRVQAEKHETVKTDRGTFKFREPKSSDWR